MLSNCLPLLVRGSCQASMLAEEVVLQELAAWQAATVVTARHLSYCCRRLRPRLIFCAVCPSSCWLHVLLQTLTSGALWAPLRCCCNMCRECTAADRILRCRLGPAAVCLRHMSLLQHVFCSYCRRLPM
jgi:hypothetical protein